MGFLYDDFDIFVDYDDDISDEDFLSSGITISRKFSCGDPDGISKGDSQYRSIFPTTVMENETIVISFVRV